MLWLLAAAGVFANMVLALAVEYPLVVKVTNNFSFKFRNQHVQKLHDCLCTENNTQCVVIHKSRFSVQEIKGPSIGSQCSLNTTFYKCDIKIDGVLNITCTRTLTPPDMCLDCHPLCFTNTAPCDVNAVIEENRKSSSNFTVEINDDNMKHCVTPCPDSNALSSTQIAMNETKIVIIAVLSSVVFIAIILIIITVYFHIKRKRQVEKTTISSIKFGTNNFLKDNNGGFYDDGRNTSSIAYPDLLPQQHNHEVE
ncbi:hypothetical protein BsWGS_25347 [Bradybaena similaris]